MTISFADLIAPITPDEFFKDYYGQKPLYVPGDPEKFASVMSWDVLNRILGLNAFWSPSNLKLFQDLAPVPVESYCQSVPGLGARVMRPDPELVKVQLARGATLVLNSIDTLTPEIQDVSNILERTLHGYTQLNLYCSFADHKAFDSHFDTHEVFAFHAEGEKTWYVWEGCFDTPVHHPTFLEVTNEQHHRNRGELLMELTMTPGDFLYLPRGQYHDALASSDACLHLTFGVIPLRGLDLFELLEEEARAYSLFRQDLPALDSEGGDALRQRLVELSDKIKEMVQEPNIVDAIIQMQKRRHGTRGGYDLPMRPETNEFVLRAKGLKVTRRGDRYFLRSEKAGIPIPPGAHEFVSWVLEQPRFMDNEVHTLFAHLGSERVDELLAQLQNMDVIGRV